MNKVLVTGAAGFIGYHVSKLLIENGYHVVGLDNMNSYYEVSLKEARLDQLNQLDASLQGSFRFERMDIVDSEEINRLFEHEQFDTVIHLAAQAGVRYSLKHPEPYVTTNINGFFNILDASKNHHIKQLYYASSSSVYGNQNKVPYSVEDRVDHPISMYAATKKANELMAHSYSHLHGLNTTGLRFFTVYGPWGRPDMAPMLFLKALHTNQPIQVFNNGDLQRDFTYVGDIAAAILKLVQKDNKASCPNYRLFNIGNAQPIILEEFITLMEDIAGKQFIRQNKPMQPGDVYKTHADVSALESYIGAIGHTPLKEGLRHFVAWYHEYYHS
ncbi:MAG: SDR family NAD(P)-dependent oxidoreductase [Flavobacteriaceae bacterium]